jgi:hypothetical protein
VCCTIPSKSTDVPLINIVSFLFELTQAVEAEHVANAEEIEESFLLPKIVEESWRTIEVTCWSRMFARHLYRQHEVDPCGPENTIQ